MTDYDLTEQLIELEYIQRERFTQLARGREAEALIEYYKLPANTYRLIKESGPDEGFARRTRVRFNFGLVTDDIKPKFIEAMFMLGYSPDFISEALSDDMRDVVTCLNSIVNENRVRRAEQLRKNPQRFRLVDKTD